MNVTREVERINEEELRRGIVGTSASWHETYRDTAWVFIGNLDHRLSEGDVLQIFSQYGEIEDINLVRDSETGRSKGFAFLKYEDQRSTVLAVDNFNGTEVLSRTLRVDHTRYSPPKKKKKEIQKEIAARVMPTLQGAGHAYHGKKLAGDFTLQQGVNPFEPGKVPSSFPTKDDAGSDDDNSDEDLHSTKGERKRKRRSESEKRKKKKKKKKRRRKEKKKENERRRRKGGGEELDGGDHQRSSREIATRKSTAHASALAARRMMEESAASGGGFMSWRGALDPVVSKRVGGGKERGNETQKN